MNVTRLDFHHDPAEDRLVLTAHGIGAAPVTLTLTRRLTRSVLGKLVELLMGSSPTVSRAPARYREEVLLFEFASALSEEEPPAGAATGRAEPPLPHDIPPPPVLVTRVDFRLPPSSLELCFFDPSGPRVNIALTRTEAHRLLDRLARKTREAEWGFDELNWIDRRGQVMMPDTMVMS